MEVLQITRLLKILVNQVITLKQPGLQRLNQTLKVWMNQDNPGWHVLTPCYNLDSVRVNHYWLLFAYYWLRQWHKFSVLINKKIEGLNSEAEHKQREGQARR